MVSTPGSVKGLQFIQANLQRSKTVTAELFQVAKDSNISVALLQEPYVGNTGVLKQHSGTKIIQCTLNRQKPVKAAVAVFCDQVEVIHDPQLVTETEAAVLLVGENLRLGVISVYLEGDQDIKPYLNRIRTIIKKLNTNYIILAGDINAWSHWWGSASEDSRGAEYHSFLTEINFEILNIGDTPTFEVFRGGRECTSIVDVTACALPLLGKIDNWRVDRSLLTSDHNAITFCLRLETALKQLEPVTTRRYNVKKADWSGFGTLFHKHLEESNITTNSVREIKTPESLESTINIYTEAIHSACENTIPLTKQWKGKVTPPWWSKHLEELKKDVLRKKRRVRNAASTRKQSVLQDYIDTKAVYITQVEKAQTESWKEFCSKQEKESMWDGIYRVIRKTAKRHEDTLLRNTNGITLSPTQSAELLTKTFYPDDSVETDNYHHTQLREQSETSIGNLPDDDPPFTSAELDLVLSSLNPRKAPGPDGLCASICTASIKSDEEVFLAIANKCLTLSYFPKPWKIAHVVIIRKPGKEDYTQPKSYRPIGLLSVLGKIIEKMMVTRIQWHILPTLNNKQYGFTPQRGTEDALYDLVGFLKEGIRRKDIVLLISLDIEGAFDNAWWPTLKQQLKTKRCPRNLYLMVCSYLKDRKVRVNYSRATYEKETTKGCIQGSIGGPTFWNIILDSLLHKLELEGVYCQAFADDVTLVFTGQSTAILEEKANATLEIVHQWGIHNKLNFAPHKTNAMVLTRKLKCGQPYLSMAGVRINIVNDIKLLGLTIDNKLTFKAHVAASCKKAADIYKQLACAARVTWGLNGEITRVIYVSVVEAIMTYASCAW